MGLHSDDEKELGKNPVIASLPLGESREIYFKHKNKKSNLVSPKVHGQLMVRHGKTQ